MASRKNSSRLPASSFAWIDNPVALPPGFARLATRPLPTGSIATGRPLRGRDSRTQELTNIGYWASRHRLAGSGTYCRAWEADRRIATGETREGAVDALPRLSAFDAGGACPSRRLAVFQMEVLLEFNQ